MKLLNKRDMRLILTVLFLGVSIASAYAQPWGKGTRQLTKSLGKTSSITSAATRRVPSVQPLPRVNGANISHYSPSAQKWAATYALNARFLSEGTPLSSPITFTITENARALLSNKLKLHFPTKNEKLSPEQHIVSLDFKRYTEWLEAHEESIKNALHETQGMEADFVVIQNISESNLMFFGEIHGQVAPRLEFADIMKQFRKIYPQRRVVVFLESLYLKPLASEKEFPYQYYRRGEEGVEEPFDITDTENPNFRLMDENSNYSQMLQTLQQQNIEMYPLEDAVIAQKVSNAGKIATVEGLLERNRGFARTMHAQMDRIRQTDPDALFIYYGGMGHSSWVLPSSLPKFFANEKPLVVELVSEQKMETMSLVEDMLGKGHPAFVPTGEKRVFFWQGADKALWGRNTGFDMRLVFP